MNTSKYVEKKKFGPTKNKSQIDNIMAVITYEIAGILIDYVQIYNRRVNRNFH